MSFGTSGHRGTPFNGTFTEAHILAITQAICDYRRGQGTSGPLYLGKDTHALSGPAQRTALEVLAANGVEAVIQCDDGFTPTPVISHAILVHNRGGPRSPADGIVITPSHNPPEDGGFKYNPPNGGPADTDVTQWNRGAGQRAAQGGERRSQADAVRAGTARRPRPGSRTSSCPTCGTWATWWTWRRSVPPAWRWRSIRWEGPPGRTGSRSTRTYGLNITIVNPVDRSDLRVHDRRPRRPDPDGLLEPLGDGAAGRAQGPTTGSPLPTIPMPIGTAS